MRVLLLGATGNLGSRLIPALLAHGHIVIASVRSRQKLHTIIPLALFNRIMVVEGDALDSGAVEEVLRTYDCDVVVNAAGTRILNGEQILGRIASAVSAAAIRVGKQRGRKPLRAWFIGGMGSLEYPGTGRYIQDFLPRWTSDHHRETESVMRATPTTDLEWTLLCVAMMTPESSDIVALEYPRGHSLTVTTRSPPDWRESPPAGIDLDLMPVIMSYTTRLEEVADFIAECLVGGNGDAYVGELVGMKTRQIGVAQ